MTESEIIGFAAYKRMVVRRLEMAGFKGDAVEFAESLDMSFMDLIEMNVPVDKWHIHIDCDLVEYKADVPEDFE